MIDRELFADHEQIVRFFEILETTVRPDQWVKPLNIVDISLGLRSEIKS